MNELILETRSLSTFARELLHLEFLKAMCEKFEQVTMLVNNNDNAEGGVYKDKNGNLINARDKGDRVYNANVHPKDFFENLIETTFPNFRYKICKKTPRSI